MHIATDIGRRVELVSMDPHCANISIGLYKRETDGGPIGIVHSYSGRPGVSERLAFVSRAIRVLGGLEPAGEQRAVRFPCHMWHPAAAKRLFLESCKHDPVITLERRPLEAPDPRTEQTIRVQGLGKGTYRVDADGATEDVPSRSLAVAAALAKLAELETGEDPGVIRFACGHDHDALLGVLLVRAMNLRAALREEELSATRGVLVAPSAQE